MFPIKVYKAREPITHKQRGYLIEAYKRHGIKQEMPTDKATAIKEIAYLKSRDASVGLVGGRHRGN